ncbi:MAG: hypothetical protein ACLQVI_31830 [Polyangiaceae bacterium]
MAIGGRTTDVSDVPARSVKTATATAAAAARERGPFADDDPADERGGHESRKKEATDELRTLRLCAKTKKRR